jgi:hypothetical protein
MVKNKILILKSDASLYGGKLEFPKGTEFEIVMDIVYMGGYPIPIETQKMVYDWLVANMSNKQMFKEDFR